VETGAIVVGCLVGVVVVGVKVGTGVGLCEGLTLRELWETERTQCYYYGQ